MFVEFGLGFMVLWDLLKLGYKGVEFCELLFDNFWVLVLVILGGVMG